MMTPIAVQLSSNSLARVQKGAAWAEFTIIMPLIMLFLFAIISLGNTLTRTFSFSNLGYEAVMAGGSSTTDYAMDAMQARYEQLRQIDSSSYSVSKMSSSQLLVGAQYSDYDSDAGNVTSHLTGSAGSIVDYLDKTLTMRYTAPIVAKKPDTSIDMNNFYNPDCGYWTCNGLSCSGTSSTTPCWTAPANTGNPGSPPCACFSGDTPVTLANGMQKPISEIKVGTMVLAYNTEAKSPVHAAVTHVFAKRTVDQYYLLNGSIKVTAEHPFYVSGQWIPVRNLKLGDKFQSITGDEVELTSRQVIDEKLEIYNLTVDGVHNYYAAGVLVHNKTSGPCSGYTTTSTTNPQAG